MLQTRLDEKHRVVQLVLDKEFRVAWGTVEQRGVALDT